MYAPLIKSVDGASLQLIFRHLFVRGWKKTIDHNLRETGRNLTQSYTKPPQNLNVYSIIWGYFESLKELVFYFIKYMIWAVASCSNSMMHVYFHSL